jgi:flagellar motor switch protein FliN/FliY
MPENNKKRQSLAAAFGLALTKSLKEACSSSWETGVSENPVASTTDLETSAHFQFIFGGDLEGKVVLILKHVDALTLGLRDVSGDTNVFAEAHATALLAAFNLCGSDLGGRLQEYGKITITVEVVTTPVWMEDPVIDIWAQAEEPDRKISFLLFADKQLLRSMKDAAPSLANALPVAINQSNLDLVMDVELNVTLRFGQRRLSLREVLDLTSGSVVELDRQVDEPVELVLDGRVVARGDAVIIDGNYGLRITQVVQSFVP